MANQVRMKSKSVFRNDRITVFVDGKPDGEKGRTVTVGEEFETDLGHAKELHRFGLADPVNASDLDAETPPLEPHFQVSEDDLRRDRARRGQKGEGAASTGGAVSLSGNARSGAAPAPAAVASPQRPAGPVAATAQK